MSAPVARTHGIPVAVDAAGADLGPAEVAAGAALAAERGVPIRLFGPADELGPVPDGVEVVDAPVSIAKAPDPARAVRSTPEASIVQAARAVADGECAAMVAGGTTGPALAAGLFNVKRARGVHRPALALPLPVPGSPVILLDVGANETCRPEHLVQFAYMGAALARAVFGVDAPRVGLLANGTEPDKGRDEVVAAHAALAGRSDAALAFVGNLEGFDVTSGAADVVVTDGFTGNIALKLIEGVSRTLLGAIRDVATSSARAKAGGLLLRPSLGGLRDGIDPEGVGGAYLLGLRRLAVVPHGSFTRRGICEAIVRADRGVRSGLVDRIHDDLAAAGALRRRPPAAERASGAAATVPDR